MNLANIKTTKDLTAPKDSGKHFRLLCMTGDNKGIVYYLLGNRVTAGRGDKTDIQIKDSKSSRVQFDLVLKDGQYVLTDLQSQNGTIVNDLKVSQQNLWDGDIIVVGKTVYRYNTYDIKKNALTLSEDNSGNSENKSKFEFKEQSFEDNEAVKKKKGMSPILLIVIAAGLYFYLFGDDQPKKVRKVKNSVTGLASSNTLGSTNSSDEDKETLEEVEGHIHRGLRELREKNYFRSMNEFNQCRLKVPGHGRCTVYLNTAKKRLDDYIKKLETVGRKLEESLSYQKALTTNCSIIRILQNNTDDERYKKAESKIKDLTIKMGIEESEVNCTER